VTRYLLDTNTCIEYVRQTNWQVARRIEANRPRKIRLCSIVVAELFFGAFCSSDRERNMRLVRELTDTFISFSFDDDAAEIFGSIRASLEATGNSIGPYDLEIASIAIARDLTLVTHNTSEFSRVPGLIIEDWQV